MTKCEFCDYKKQLIITFFNHFSFNTTVNKTTQNFKKFSTKMSDSTSSTRKRRAATVLRVIKWFLATMALVLILSFFIPVKADGDHRKENGLNGVGNSDKSNTFNNENKQQTNNDNNNSVGISDNLRSDCHTVCDCPDVPECPDSIELSYGDDYHPLWFFFAGAFSAVLVELIVLYGFWKFYGYSKSKWQSKRERRLEEIIENNPQLIANSQTLQRRRETQGTFVQMMSNAMAGLTDQSASSRANFDGLDA